MGVLCFDLEYSSKGLLVPDDMTVRLWSEHIHRLASTHQFQPEEEILLLDGIPRNRTQAEMMDAHIEVIRLIVLEATDEQKLIERIHRRALHEHRLDDAHEEVIRRRFEEYHKETEPVLDYYPKELISRVDANGTPIEVLTDVINVVRRTLDHYKEEKSAASA